MKSFKQFIREEIDISTLHKWKEDSLAWSKNIRRINTPEELQKVRKEYNAWIKNLEHFVYVKVLKSTGEGYKPPTWWAKEASEKFWDFYIKATPFHSEKMGYYDYKTSNHLSPDNPEMVQRSFDYWNKEKKYKYVRYLALARAAFEALNNYFENEKNVPDGAVEVDVSVDGVPVRFEFDEEDNFLLKDKERVIKDLKDSFKLLKSRGFSRVISGLKVIIEDRFVASEGGHYDPATTSIHASLWGVSNSKDAVHVFTHECGHRWYYEFLSNQARQDWVIFCQHEEFKHVSTYSEKNASETFAETFSWYVRSLNIDQLLKAKFISIAGV